jgi:HPt (histidine-containing phosphotransfer) domain-containing protein
VIDVKKNDLIAMGIDYDDAMNRFMNNEEMYMTFLNRFKDDHSYKLMREALDQNDISAAYDAAHDLKSITGNLSMKKLYYHVCLLVDDLKKDDTSHIKELLPPIIDEYTTVINMLK